MRKVQSRALLPALALLMASCQPLPGEGMSSHALSDDGGQFENPPPENDDPFAAIEPVPAVASRMHSCQKIPYDTLGNLLSSRGVNLNAVAANGQPPTAGQIYKANAATLGQPNYLARLREVTSQTTSGATKLLDIFIQAAPEIVAAMPNLAACKVLGVGPQMFNNGKCTVEGVSCLQGYPATQQQADLCTAMLADIPGPTGQRLAVAAILATAHACE